MRYPYLALLLAVAPVTAMAQAPAITGATLQTGIYQNRSLQATESVSLTDGFSVDTEGFEATIKSLGSWSATQAWPFISIHTHLAPNGQVVAWQGHNDNCFANPTAPGCAPQHQGTDVYYWYSGPAGTVVPGTTHDHVTWSNLFCSGHTLLADGQLFVAGGHYAANPNTIVGLRQANTYNYRVPFGTVRYNAVTGMNEPAAWGHRADMDKRTRWYPTTITLPNGEVLVVGGETNTVGDGNMLDGLRHDNQPQIWNPATNTWRWLPGAGLQVPLYPMLFVAPNGQVFCAGPMPITQSRYLDPSGNGAWSVPFTDAANQNNAASPGSHYGGTRSYGTPVLYDRGKLLIIGGGNNDANQTVTNTVQMVDLTGSAPAFRMAAPMQYPRMNANATVLPTGQVLVSGGSITAPGTPDYAVLPAEIWTPPTAGTPGGRWEMAAPLSTPRMYHSTALLLPDGRVLTAGGGDAYGATDFPSAQVYSPSYLEAGYRPEITYAPATIGYGQPFTVLSLDAGSVTKVTLIRLSSVTHSLNMNQRLNTLAYYPTANGQGLTITPPANANDAPPGHYLLFVLTDGGIPAEGRVVQLTAATCAPQLGPLVSRVSYAGNCTSEAVVSASGTNIGTDFRWFVNGVYQPALDNRSEVRVALSTNLTQATVRAEVSSTCGGGTAAATTTVDAVMPGSCFL